MITEEYQYGAIIFFAVVIFFLVYGIWSIYTTWQLFKKAGQPGWAALIPVYQNYIIGVIAGLPIWLIAGWIALAIANNFYNFFGIIYFPLSLYVLFRFIPKYNASVGFWLAYIFVPMISVFMVKNVAYIGTDAGVLQSSGQPEPTYQPPVAGEPQSASKTENNT